MEHIQLVEKAPDEPGLKMCISSGAVDGPFVSLGLGRDNRTANLGWMLLHAKVAEYVARAIGWVPEQEAQRLRDDLAAARAENAQILAQLADVDLNREKVENAEKLQEHARGLISALNALVVPEAG